MGRTMYSRIPKSVVPVRNLDKLPIPPLTLRFLPVPLFWTQPGYSLKPAPQLSPDRTHDQHLNAISRHLDRTVRSYGPHVRVHAIE